MDHRAAALLAWINGFESVAQDGLVDISDLCESTVLRRVLVEIDPFFSALDSALVEGADLTWSEKASNLDKIKLALDTYYAKVLLKGLKVEDDIDTSAIAKGRGFDDFVNLMELVCGAAALCMKHALFDRHNLKLSETSQLYLRELRENIVTNTYDINDDKNVVSDLSDDGCCSESDSDSTESLSLSPSKTKERARVQEESLLSCHLRTKADLEIQKTTIRKNEAEKIHLNSVISSLRATNLSLQETALEQSTKALKLEEQVCATLAANTALQHKIAFLATEKQAAESRCSSLANAISSMQEEVKSAKELKLELEKAQELVDMYKHKVECLTPVLAINEHLEASLKDTQAQLEAVEMAVSTRIRLEGKHKTTDLEDMKKAHQQMAKDLSSSKEQLKSVTASNEVLKEELKAKELLVSEHEKLQDELSLQYIHSMKQEQTINSHKAIFLQYKTLIKDTYQIIENLRAKEKKHSTSPSKKKKKTPTLTPASTTANNTFMSNMETMPTLSSSSDCPPDTESNDNDDEVTSGAFAATVGANNIDSFRT